MTMPFLSKTPASRTGKRNIHLYACVTFTAHFRHKKGDGNIEIDEAKGKNKSGDINQCEWTVSKSYKNLLLVEPTNISEVLNMSPIRPWPRSI